MNVGDRVKIIDDSSVVSFQRGATGIIEAVTPNGYFVLIDRDDMTDYFMKDEVVYYTKFEQEVEEAMKP